MIRLWHRTENITPIYNSKWFGLHFTIGASFLTYGAYQKIFYAWYRKYWHLVQGKTAKYLVFGSDFVTYGAPFYKWCRFTYSAVTMVFRPMPNVLTRYRMRAVSYLTHTENSNSKSNWYHWCWVIIYAKGMFSLKVVIHNYNVIIFNASLLFDLRHLKVSNLNNCTKVFLIIWYT